MAPPTHANSPQPHAATSRTHGLFHAATNHPTWWFRSWTPSPSQSMSNAATSSRWASKKDDWSPDPRAAAKAGFTAGVAVRAVRARAMRGVWLASLHWRTLTLPRATSARASLHCPRTTARCNVVFPRASTARSAVKAKSAATFSALNRDAAAA
jgi:hypothetical protein